MRIAYFTGVIPNKENTKVLIEIEECLDSVSDFDRQVFNKDYAKYTINKFKIKNIIDELCNKYTVFKFYIYDNIKYKIDDIVEKKVFCYFTPKATLSDLICNKVKKLYHPDGEIKEKINYDNNKNRVKYTAYHTNGNKKQLILYGGEFYNSKHGDYKEWNYEGKLIKYHIYENDKMIKDVLEDDVIYLINIIKNKINNLSEYNENTKYRFVKNLKKIFQLISLTIDPISKIKYVKILFDCLDTSIGIEIIKQYANLRTTIKQKITELFQRNIIVQLSTSNDEKKQNLYKKFCYSLVNINNIITEIEK
jgi:hypothetical protein